MEECTKDSRENPNPQESWKSGSIRKSKYIKRNINPTGKSNKNPNDNEDKSKYLIHGAI